MDFTHPRYNYVRDLGTGNFGTAKLLQHRQTGELVACKYIPRGSTIDKNVEREIMNHRALQHPNVIQFKEVFLTSTHLGIVMEYAPGGELFDRIVQAGKFGEDEARYYFQQLICGVEYCHSGGVCHRDLKLENTLLDGKPAPQLKLCDFGYSKSAVFDSQPKTTVGTPAYIAPEVLSRKQYNGESADVWSCGVTLYVMLVGAYPFEDVSDPTNFRRTIQRIMEVRYRFPEDLPLSTECRDIMRRIFVGNPAERITIAQIKQHPWFKRNLPSELRDGGNAMGGAMVRPWQSEEDVRRIVAEARTVKAAPEDFDEDHMDHLNHMDHHDVVDLHDDAVALHVPHGQYSADTTPKAANEQQDVMAVNVDCSMEVHYCLEELVLEDVGSGQLLSHQNGVKVT